MKLKFTVLNQSESSEPLCATSWNSSEEVFSCGDDQTLQKWNLLSKDAVKICEFPNNVYPIDLHCLVKNHGGLKKQQVEQILLTSADGKFHVIGKTGRIEKSVEAHRGAVLVGKWSNDGSSLLSAGEDGQIKIWSRSGMLRSTVVQEAVPIYCATWSPDSNSILYSSNRMLVIKSLSAKTKSHRWKAHDGLILKVSWNTNNNLIVSGGEDSRYKVNFCCYDLWDTYGRQLYASIVHENPITSIAWAPSGDLFAVGSFNMIRLCDKAGWSHHLAKITSGSIYGISWSNDGTQIACACANGNLLLGHIIERRISWLNYDVTQISRKCLQIKDISNDITEKLDIPERIIQLNIGFKHVVVATPAQCYVFNVNNFNTPNIIELKDGSVSVILLAEKYFGLVERFFVNIYSYDGKNVTTPKWPNMQCDLINRNMISLSSDMLAIRDQIDDKVVHLLEIGSNAGSAPFTHKTGITDICLNQHGPISDRHLAFIDKNRDLYLIVVLLRTNFSPPRKVEKLGVLVQSVCWNADYNILAGIQEASLTIWYYPAMVFVDNRSLKKSVYTKDTKEFGRSPEIINFTGNHVVIRRSDGSLINNCISPFVAVLHALAAANNWQQALKLCRNVKDDKLWTCLAGLAVHSKELETAEEAYAAVELLDKVSFIQFIMSIKNKAVQSSEILLMGGNVEHAESMLLQNGMIFRAIFINMRMHRWIRALDLAIKHKTHVDTVLFYRWKYLLSLNKEEKSTKFLEFKEMELDENTIEQKVKLEMNKDLVR